MNNGFISVLRGLEEIHPENTFILDLRKAVNNFPEAAWGRAMDRSQVRSKLWLIQEMEKSIGINPLRNSEILICGGWYGLLARLILDQFPDFNLKIRSFDLDPTCSPIADRLNKRWEMQNWAFKAFTADMHKLNYHNIEFKDPDFNCDPDVIINTSCEHIDNFNCWFAKLPLNKTVILQSTNLEDPQHVNTVNSLKDFKKSAPMKYSFEGQLAIKNGENQRFMLIGEKI